MKKLKLLLISFKFRLQYHHKRVFSLARYVRLVNYMLLPCRSITTNDVTLMS